MDYKDTLNLPRTAFPMRGNLPQKEPVQVEKWEREGIHEKMVEANRSGPRFILHDGPPYANERIHIGHALNKVLKDVIIKYKSMRGYCAPYVPGWDCHGLPIELQVEKSLGREKKNRLSKVEVRRLCRAHAEKFIGVQREEFKRLGVLGRWAEPYRTIDFAYEAAEVRELGKFMADGSVYRSKKPVYWCASCATALAEAEVEYDNQVTPSVYVKFPVKDAKGKLPGDADSAFAIWTTTPWTLPANQAIALHPRMQYRRVRTPAGVLIVAADLAPSLMEVFEYGPGQFEVLEGSWSGADLEGIVCSHPWLDREVVVILGEFVTAAQGTGCVHVAPGHGHEDYEAGQRYGLEAYAPVDGQGRFTAEAGEFQGEMVFRANPRIIARLSEDDRLLKSQEISHSYPHCWRCKKPVLFRATEQWFIPMDRNGLRQGSLEAIDQVQWIPPWGRDRISGMLANRPDWCISRQRSWGVPIPVLYCLECGETHLSEALCEHVARLFEQEGSDAWFVRPVEELAPPGFCCNSCGSTRFSKEEDILDVWFDSGVSHAAVVEPHPELGRADLYLEGSDQHRGWFHTSLLTSVANRGRAPYDGVLTHGFVLDGKGHKMSKSLGNVTAPQEITRKFGADIIRLWVAAEDYREDVRISEEILNRLVESYRRLRNTARFLVGNLHDFDPDADAVSPDALEALDRWILHRTQRLLGRCIEAFDRFEFHLVYHALNNYCSVELSSLYLDIVKDRLYCEAPDSVSRRSAQTALHGILQTLVHLMAPILSFTAEEIWEHAPRTESRPESVLLSPMPQPDEESSDPALAAEWELRLDLRGEVLKALEAARQSGAIGHSLDARVALYPDAYHRAPGIQGLLRDRAATPWEDVFIVSQVSVVPGAPSADLVYPNLRNGDGEKHEGAADGAPAPGPAVGYDSLLLGAAIGVYTADGGKCERCWKYHPGVGEHAAHPGVCPRCAEVLRSLPQAENARA